MLYILSGSPRLKSRHPHMPERFWDIQHNQGFETDVNENLGKRCDLNWLQIWIDNGA